MLWLESPAKRGDRNADLEETIHKLEAYCRERQWAGFDPYDALNSEVFGRTPLAKSRIARLAFTQLLKRSPVNLRPVLGIRPRQDPKALALFLMAYVKRAHQGDEASRATAGEVADRLLDLHSPGTVFWCWGYSFPWQTRHRLVPRFAPNLVCTTFAANALLDAHELGLYHDYLTPATSAGEYIAQKLFWHDSERAAFAYPLPDIRVPIHNANFLGAALLCRLSRITGDSVLREIALRAARYSARAQRADGSWTYGTGSDQQWVDNFHTGYNLCALESIGRYLNTAEFDGTLRKGLRFYVDHFFAPNGAPRYFHNRLYPIDIHCVAHSLVTLTALRRFDPYRLDRLARSVLVWAMQHMWDERGFFYYRVLRSGPIRTPRMRCAQGWGLLALASLASLPRMGNTCRAACR